MQNAGSDENIHFKLAQIWQVAGPSLQSLQQVYSRNCIINEILKDDFNVNQKFTLHLKFASNQQSRLEANIRLKNCTMLHFLYYALQNFDMFTTLIARGADFTLKNENGQTVFHLMITQSFDRFTHKRSLFFNSVLSAHVKSQNFTNPCDNDGISHFHGACMANHAEAAELFLDNGASVEETVKFDAPQCAGWTPLHFAVAFGSFKVVQVLVERGANVNATTAKGENPLDLLFSCHYPAINLSQNEISKKEELVKLLLGQNAVSYAGLSSLHIACTLKDLTIAERLLDEGVDIEYAVPSESSICPGHTALHFAAENGIEAVKMLVKRGAKFDIAIVQKDQELGLYKAKYSLQQLCEILSCIESVKELRLSDGRTILLDLILSMESLNNFRRFLQNEVEDIKAVVPGDSVLWPGYTILHLAVTFSKILVLNGVLHQRRFDIRIVEECLNRGLSLDVPNPEEQTSVHLAYSQNRDEIVKLMLERLNRLDAVTNIVDQNNLSYLHIACAIGNEALADRLLGAPNPMDLCRRTTKSVAHMEAGSTPLHAAVSSGSRAIAELLLRRGADLHATDANGLTPIHLLYQHIFADLNEIVGCLLAALSTNVVDRVVDGLGLSYLHIASAFGYAEIVEKLLDLGSNVNAVIEYQKQHEPKDGRVARMCLSIYANFTPLQMAIYNRNPSDKVLKLLLRRGADVFANLTNEFVSRTLRGYCAPFKNPRVLQRFFRALWEQEAMQKSTEQKLGLTKLHVACFLKDGEVVRSALTDGVDVNVLVRADSMIFAGCTPLHLLVNVSVGGNLWNIQNTEITIGNMVKMLIDRGADVTIINAEMETPLHVFSKLQRYFLDRDLCKDLLLNAHRDFSLNPVNDEGCSHFHLACCWHRVEIVQKFLQHGSVDVNQPLDYFIREMAGCTPLHLALSSPMTQPNADWTRLSQTVDLLLNHGADVAAKDVNGNTPLHTRGALCSPGMSVFEKLVSYGGDTKRKNLQGQSPIERLASISVMNTSLSDYLTVFKKYGYRINSWNRLTGEGYIAKIFICRSLGKLSENSEFKEFIESSDARTVDDLGRTAIHNVVAHPMRWIGNMLEDYKYVVESFIKIGIDIDHRDKSGQTALHYAARMENLIGVQALLTCGADVNAIDNSGKSSFCYAMKLMRDKRVLGISMHPDSTTILSMHVRQLQHLKLEVSHLNQSFAKEVKPSYDSTVYGRNCNKLINGIPQQFFSRVEITKTLAIGTNSLSLYDFLSETAALTLYPLLLKSERELVDRFFETIDYNDLKEIVGIVKLQTRKMKARLGLIDSALSSLRMLLGFSVPGLCEQISRFLLNSDLKNLIQSTASNSRKRKLLEISS